MDPESGVDGSGTTFQMIQTAFNATTIDNGTNLAIAMTSFHEMLHVYFIHLYLDGNLMSLGAQIQPLQDALTAYYANPNITTTTTADNAMHNAFIPYVPSLAQALVDWCAANGVSGVDINYATSLVRGTLQTTTEFTNLTVPQQTESINAHKREILNGNYGGIGPKSAKTCN